MKSKFYNHEDYYAKNIRDPGQKGRLASRLIFLRSFNNWVKATQIKNYAYKAGRNLAVLDMCCGRGGDLEKYFRTSAKLYVGVDLEENLLVNAMDRITKLSAEKMKNNLQVKCILIKDDASDPDGVLVEKYPPGIEFDICACQFALHYHFESEARLKQFLFNATSRLKEGGYFFGTIIDSNVLVKRLRNKRLDDKFSDQYTFGNNYYAVKFNTDKFQKDQVFGLNYGFYLEDSIDKRGDGGEISFVGEYLIVFEEFVNVALSFDLHLVEEQNFHDYYKDKIGERMYADLFKIMVKDNNESNLKEQWEITQLYKVFCFRKGLNNTDGNSANPIDKLTFKDFKPELKTDKFD